MHPKEAIELGFEGLKKRERQIELEKFLFQIKKGKGQPVTNAGIKAAEEEFKDFFNRFSGYLNKEINYVKKLYPIVADKYIITMENGQVCIKPFKPKYSKIGII